MPVTDARSYWLHCVDRIASPVLEAAAGARLKQRMPVVTASGAESRAAFASFEALGRLLAGISPWLENPNHGGGAAEERLRARFAGLARRAIESGTDDRSPDYFELGGGTQPLAEAAFLALAVLRAPSALWDELDDTVKQRFIAFLLSTRRIQPGYNNWILFPALIETFLRSVGEEWDQVRVDYALRQHEAWFVGEGIYSDGPSFRWDYYNGLVIHPLLVEVASRVGNHRSGWGEIAGAVERRATAYAAIQERLISPEGTYPPIGRSLAYRFGVFHALAQCALRGTLPSALAPSQVRSALTAVMRRQLDRPGTFDADGWLQIGLVGHDSSIGERYITTGSLYLCSVALLPLGLAASHPFWSGPDAPWTSKHIWRS